MSVKEDSGVTESSRKTILCEGTTKDVKITLFLRGKTRFQNRDCVLYRLYSSKPQRGKK